MSLEARPKILQKTWFAATDKHRRLNNFRKDIYKYDPKIGLC